MLKKLDLYYEECSIWSIAINLDCWVSLELRKRKNIHTVQIKTGGSLLLSSDDGVCLRWFRPSDPWRDRIRCFINQGILSLRDSFCKHFLIYNLQFLKTVSTSLLTFRIDSTSLLRFGNCFCRKPHQNFISHLIFGFGFKKKASWLACHVCPFFMASVWISRHI